MVLTQQKDTAQYLASMEGAFRSTEVQLFGNITNTAYARNSVSGYPANTQFTNPNDSVSKVDFNGSSGQKTGPSLLLKVMSGDTIKIGVQSYYNSGSGSSNNSSFTDVLNSLANAVVRVQGEAMVPSQILLQITVQCIVLSRVCLIMKLLRLVTLKPI